MAPGVAMVPEGGNFPIRFTMVSLISEVQCGAPKIAFSWFITPITMVYGTYNYSYWGL